MSEENNAGPQKGETAEAFKERIEEAQRELKRSEKVAAKAIMPLPAQVPPIEAPKKNGATGNAEVDEWWEKKGFKSAEDLAQSYRELEREMHRKANEARTIPQGQAQVTPVMAPPMPNYPPYYSAPQYQQPPMYQPPIQPQMNVEQLAKQYGLSPEDFEKVAPLVNDMARSVVDSTLQRVLPPIMNQVQGVNREVGRQKELVDLMSDPVFKTPQVQFEMDRIFKEEPNAFIAQTQPIRYAYDKALTRIARANLGGSTGQPALIEPGIVPSNSRPPATAGGNGNGGGGAPSGSPQEMTPQLFAGLSMAEKGAYLAQIGARPR